MISVILTTHDGRKDVCKEAIDSVLDQTYSNLELIVVDDASSDGTEEMVKSIDDDRITYSKREENFGNDTKPKNEGILLSKGDFISFLDSDNTYRPDHLAILIKNLEQDPELDGVYGDRFVTVNGEKKGLGVHGEWDRVEIFNKNYIDTSDVLFRRECIFDMGGFDEEYKKFIDWNLWLRMAKAGKQLKRVPMVITNYNLLKDSKSFREEDTVNNRPAWNPLSCTVRLDYLGKQPEPKIAVFSLTYDRLGMTKACFQSLHKTAGAIFDHIVVDNGSKDGTPEYLKELEVTYSNLKVIYNEDNKGISIASNQAMDEIVGKYDLVVKVDNDCLFKTEGWLAKMVEVWKSYPKIALSCYIEGLKDNPGGAPRMDYLTIKDELIGITQHLGGICRFVDTEAYREFRLNEEDHLHGVQDMEVSQYLMRNGYILGYLENFYAEHCYGTEGQHERFPKYFERRKVEKTTRYNK